MASIPEKIFVRPAPGLIIRDPVSMRPLKEEGEMKPRGPYWLRRVRCGDCLEGKPSAHKASKNAPPKELEPEPAKAQEPAKSKKDRS